MPVRSLNGRAAAGRARGVVAALAVVALSAGVGNQTGACALEPALLGGFSVSYPGSLRVAAAVARERRAGVLPASTTGALPNDLLLGFMIGDLRRLQSRLEGSGGHEPARFSLVLVGPGLWSHYHLSGGAVLARYHADGPLPDTSVVLTHHAVLQALLAGHMSVREAVARGLLSFDGVDTRAVVSAFEAGFASRTSIDLGSPQLAGGPVSLRPVRPTRACGCAARRGAGSRSDPGSTC